MGNASVVIRVARGLLLAATFALAAAPALADATWIKANGTGFDADKQTAYDTAYAQALSRASKQCATQFVSDIVVTQSKTEYQSAAGLPGWTAEVSLRVLCHSDV